MSGGINSTPESSVDVFPLGSERNNSTTESTVEFIPFAQASCINPTAESPVGQTKSPSS
jgi:hypothetical protein